MLGLLRNNACEFSSARLGLLGSLFNQECSRPCQRRTLLAKHKICSLTGRENSAVLNTFNSRHKSRKSLWVKSGAIGSKSNISIAFNKASTMLCSLKNSLTVSPHQISFSFFDPFSGRRYYLIELSHNWPSNTENKKQCGLLELVVGAFHRRGKISLRIGDFKPGVLLHMALLLQDKEAKLKRWRYTTLCISPDKSWQLCFEGSGWSKPADLFEEPLSCLALSKTLTSGQILQSAGRSLWGAESSWTLRGSAGLSCSPAQETQILLAVLKNTELKSYGGTRLFSPAPWPMPPSAKATEWVLDVIIYSPSYGG